MIKNLILTTALVTSSIQMASAHCQIPCGIYADANVLADLGTHVATIEKSTAKILEITPDSPTAAHDLSRWTLNKENHCDQIIDTVSNYFLAQRLKTSEMDSDKESYMKKLVLCHQAIVAAMKCKQTLKDEDLQTLHSTIDSFVAAFAEKK